MNDPISIIVSFITARLATANEAYQFSSQSMGLLPFTTHTIIINRHAESLESAQGGTQNATRDNQSRRTLRPDATAGLVKKLDWRSGAGYRICPAEKDIT